MSRRYLREAFAVDDIATLIRRVHDGRVRFHSGVSEVFPGISLHLLPGHSAGLQGVGVQTARGFVLLASDSSHYYANMLLQNATRITVDQIATYRSYDRLMQIAGSLDHIVPGHDPKIRRLYPTKDLGGLMVTMLHALPLPHDPADLARLDDYAID